MQTQFITLTLPLLPTPLENRQQVETAIAEQAKGSSDSNTCLRWAITQLDRDQQILQVEAIVLTNSQSA